MESLPLERRQRGPPLLVHGGNPQKRGLKRKAVVISSGRGKPLPPQSDVVVKSIFDKNEFDGRQVQARRFSTNPDKWTDLLAPLGTRESTQSMEGELCYYRIDDSEF